MGRSRIGWGSDIKGSQSSLAFHSPAIAENSKVHLGFSGEEEEPSKEIFQHFLST
jgi:hypothetical protein